MFWLYFYAHLYIVTKAERVSNDSVYRGYIFPDEDDNLTAYAGGNAQLMIPSGLLQNISKCYSSISIHKYYTCSKMCLTACNKIFSKIFLTNNYYSTAT